MYVSHLPRHEDCQSICQAIYSGVGYVKTQEGVVGTDERSRNRARPLRPKWRAEDAHMKKTKQDELNLLPEEGAKDERPFSLRG